MFKFLIQSLLAGMLIGFGDIIYIITSNHIVGSFLFSLGLLSILVKGYPLYTGRIGYITSYKDIGEMFLMLCMNLFGIGIICYLFNYTHLNFDSVENCINIKANQSYLSAFVLSYGCGVMMYLAVNGWKKYSNPLYVIMPIMFFILCGFEHCIANFGYFCMWIGKNGIHSVILNSNMLINFALMIIGNALGSLTFSKS